MRAHDCSACHGSGTAREPNIAPTYDERWRCPVCQGSGRISDVRTAEQALVDAETARRYGIGSEAAEWAGIASRAHGIETKVAAYQRAAHAAFRAVPALREEE